MKVYYNYPLLAQRFVGRLLFREESDMKVIFDSITDTLRIIFREDKVAESDEVKEGVEVFAFDPEAMQNVKDQIGDDIHYTKDRYAALDQADALIIATEWSEFRAADFEKMGGLMKTKAIFDGRNLYDPKTMKEKGS